MAEPPVPPRLDWRSPEALKCFAATVATSALGGAVFAFAGVPVGWLIGGMLAVGLLGLSGQVTVYVPNGARSAAFVFLGMSIGTGADPSFVNALSAWPISLVGVAVASIVITTGVTLLLRRGFGWTWDTSIFAAVPGALSAVVLLADQRGSDVSRIAMVHIIRVYVLVLVAPLIVSVLFTNATPIGVIDRPLAPFHEIAWLLVVCTMGGLVAERLGFPAGLLIGSFAVSVGAHVAGFAAGAVPQPLMIPGYIVMAAFMGTRVNVISLRELRVLSVAAVLSVLLGTAIAAVLALAVSAMTGLRADQVLLAFAPGALEIMIILAFLLDIDPAFVAFHQFVRFTGMALALPLIVALVRHLENDVTGDHR